MLFSFIPLFKEKHRGLQLMLIISIPFFKGGYRGILMRRLEKTSFISYFSEFFILCKQLFIMGNGLFEEK
jgi:hypothetical protein